MSISRKGFWFNTKYSTPSGLFLSLIYKPRAGARGYAHSSPSGLSVFGLYSPRAGARGYAHSSPSGLWGSYPLLYGYS